MCYKNEDVYQKEIEWRVKFEELTVDSFRHKYMLHLL